MNKRNTILSLAVFFSSFASLHAQDVNVVTPTETNNYDDEEINGEREDGNF